MKRSMRLVLLSVCLISAFFSVYALLIKDDIFVPIKIIDKNTSIVKPHPVNVLNKQFKTAGSISVSLSFGLGMILLLGFLKRTQDRRN